MTKPILKEYIQLYNKKHNTSFKFITQIKKHQDCLVIDSLNLTAKKKFKLVCKLGIITKHQIEMLKEIHLV